MMALLWLAGALAITAIASAWLALRRASRTSAIAAGAALAGAALLLAAPRITGQLIGPELAFQQALGVPPPPAIAALSAKSEPGFGFTNLFIAFDSSPAAAQWLAGRFANARRFAERDLALRLANGGDTPDWWRGAPTPAKRGACAARQGFELRDWNGWLTVVVVDCRSDKRTYLLFSRVD